VRVETAFDPARNLIVVEGELSGPLGDTPLRLVLDTGAAESLVVPDIVDALGYSPRDAEVVTGVYSAIGKEQGYMLRVASFSALGFTLPNVRIHVFDLADRYGIDGLIGLSFLRQLNYEIRSAEGRILVEKIAP
jgi:predicted aspartyl protease